VADSRLINLIDQRIQLLTPALVRGVAGNMPPGGMHPLELSIVSPAGDWNVSVGSIPVLYKCVVESVLLVGDAAGTAVADVKRARPGETTEGDSLFGNSYPVLDNSRLSWTLPASDWVRYIEPNSVLFFYVAYSSGLGRLDIALNVRCLTG
jgi:hypothetical protein